MAVFVREVHHLPPEHRAGLADRQSSAGPAVAHPGVRRSIRTGAPKWCARRVHGCFGMLNALGTFDSALTDDELADTLVVARHADARPPRTELPAGHPQRCPNCRFRGERFLLLAGVQEPAVRAGQRRAGLRADRLRRRTACGAGRLSRIAAAAFQACDSPALVVNSDRSAMVTSWISETYGGNGSPPATSSSDRSTVCSTSSIPAPGFLTTSDIAIEPDPASEKLSTEPSPGMWVSGPSGFFSRIETRCALSARYLPLRSRNGTPCQRSVSTQSRTAA